MYHKNFLFVLKTKVFVSCTCTVKLYRATHGTCVATCNVFRVHYILLLHTRTSTFIHSGRRDSRRDSRRSKKGQKGAERGSKVQQGAASGSKRQGQRRATGRETARDVTVFGADTVERPESQQKASER